MILAYRCMFLRSRNLMVPFVVTYDLDLSRSWPLQNHVLGHISVINGQNAAKFFTQDSLGWGVSINKKISCVIWTCDAFVITLATIMQTDVFDHDTVWTKALRMTILVSRSMLLRLRILMVPFILPYYLDLCKITFLDISQFLMGKTLPKFHTRVAWVKAFKLMLSVLTYDLDLSRSWSLQNHILGHNSVIIGQNVAKF